MIGEVFPAMLFVELQKRNSKISLKVFFYVCATEVREVSREAKISFCCLILIFFELRHFFISSRVVYDWFEERGKKHHWKIRFRLKEVLGNFHTVCLRCLNNRVKSEVLQKRKSHSFKFNPELKYINWEAATCQRKKHQKKKLMNMVDSFFFVKKTKIFYRH